MNEYRPNCNIFHLPDTGENLTEEDRTAFYVAGIPLPQNCHGPRGCEADYYAAGDRRDAVIMAELMARSRAEPQHGARANIRFNHCRLPYWFGVRS